MYEVRRIGLAIDAVAGYGRGVIRGVMSYCHANPSWIIAVEPFWSFGTLPSVEQWEVDGMIVQTFSSAFEDEVLARRLPTVNVSNFLTEPSRLATVVPDDEAVGEMAADYLLSLGFRELGYCWQGTTGYGRLRFEAFRNRAKKSQVRVHECDSSKHDLGQWLTGLPKPAGVLGSNDDWAHRLLNVARRKGVKVPDEVAVLGVDDDDLFNALVTPSLSSIALPAEQIGFEAATLLNGLIDGRRAADEPICLPPIRVVQRQSTDVVSVTDVEVARAIRFIREHAGRPFQVEDLLDDVPLSRRSLERRFRRAMGRSVSAEIRRAHVERAKQLLIATDMSMSQIGLASGFTSSTRFGIVFQKEVGQPPTEFRRRSRLGQRSGTETAGV
ncbi:MAG TPA: DNA-binding transcriptional regulator [Tepidisphaeraceae bacterium]|nr:DNA-binding transcriptional regulator [Tepidisphaeraceae bacterium]